MRSLRERLAAEDGEDVELAVVGDAVRVLERLHVLTRDGEVHGGVARHVLGIGRLRQRDRAELDDIADARKGSDFHSVSTADAVCVFQSTLPQGK